MENNDIDAVLSAAEDLLAVMPDRDEDVTDEVYEEIMSRARKLESAGNRLD